MHGLLQAAKAHALPGLGVCMSRNDLLQALNERLEHTGTEEWTVMLRGGKTVQSLTSFFGIPSNPGAELEPHEFMNSKKTHEVQSMSAVVACLAQRCGVKQVCAAFLRPISPTSPFVISLALCLH